MSTIISVYACQHSASPHPMPQISWLFGLVYAGNCLLLLYKKISQCAVCLEFYPTSDDCLQRPGDAPRKVRKIKDISKVWGLQVCKEEVEDPPENTSICIKNTQRYPLEKKTNKLFYFSLAQIYRNACIEIQTLLDKGFVEHIGNNLAYCSVSLLR